VRGREPVFEHTHGGLDQWAYFQANPEQEHQFSRAMASIDHLGAAPSPSPSRPSRPWRCRVQELRTTAGAANMP